MSGDRADRRHAWPLRRWVRAKPSAVRSSVQASQRGSDVFFIGRFLVAVVILDKFVLDKFVVRLIEEFLIGTLALSCSVVGAGRILFCHASG